MARGLSLGRGHALPIPRKDNVMNSAAKHTRLLDLEQPLAAPLTTQYKPAEGASVTENPPRFSWLPVIDSGARYALRASRNPDFPAGDTYEFTGIDLNFFTPDRPFEPGHYFWNYATCDASGSGVTSTWSKAREFNIAEDLPQTPLADRKTRYAKSETSHPRLWLTGAQLASFKADLKADPNHCGWEKFFEKSVLPWLDRDIIPEPPPYPGNKRTPDVWRATYIRCQELIYAIRHMAIAGKVLDDDAFTAKAKEWLLSVSQWDPEGTTSRTYTDEWAFRVTVALAWGYDWLYDVLSDDERILVRKALLARTRQVADHVMRHANIHVFPFDSHAVRSLSAVLVPACIALLGDEPEAEAWLNYTVEWLSTLYSPWGDDEGGWAEGPHYWMTGMAYLTEAANLLRSFMGFDLYQRPFFQKTGDFPLYTKPPTTRRATFGDDSTMGDLPCLKVGYNLRQYAGVTGNGYYQWYFEELCRNDPGTEMAFYNYGWWDLNFDDLVYRHDFPAIEAVPPVDQDKLRWFKGVGWAAIQHREDSPDHHIHFVMKSSPYGSISHSHGDQNAFVMSAFGEDLAINSGHYIAFNSSMHKIWRRQTISKNALLIDGKGQYAGADKSIALKSVGDLTHAEQRDDHIYLHGDATAAYATLTPEVTRAVREVYFIHDSYFLIVDSVDADSEVGIDWLLHTNSPMQIGTDTFRYAGDRAGFYGQFVWSSAGAPTIEQFTGYEDVDEKEIEGLPISSHIKARVPKSTRHRLATLLVPYRLTQPRRVFHFLDDQGYNTDFYFTDEQQRTFKVVIQKSFEA